MKQSAAALHSIDRLPLEILVEEIYARMNVTEKRACRVVWRRVRASTPQEQDTHDWIAMIKRRDQHYQGSRSKSPQQLCQWAHDDFLRPVQTLFELLIPTGYSSSAQHHYQKIVFEVAAMGGADKVFSHYLGILCRDPSNTEVAKTVAYRAGLCAGQFAFIERTFGFVWTKPFWNAVFTDDSRSPRWGVTFFPKNVIKHWIEAKNEYALGKWADEVIARRLHVGYAGCLPFCLVQRDRDSTAWDASTTVCGQLLDCAVAGIFSVLDRFKDGSTWTKQTLFAVLDRGRSTRALDWFHTHRPTYFSPNMSLARGDINNVTVHEWFFQKGLLELEKYERFLFTVSSTFSPLREWLCSVSPRVAHWHAQFLDGLPPAIRDRIRTLLPLGDRARLKTVCILFNEEDRDFRPTFRKPTPEEEEYIVFDWRIF
jgi:hypothetical protein